MKISNFKFASKMACAFAILSLVAALSIWYASSQFRKIDDIYSALVARESRAVLLVSRSNGRLYNLGRQSMALRLAESPAEIRQLGAVVRGDRKAFDGYLIQVKSLTPAFASHADEVSKQYGAASDAFLAAEKLILEGQVAAAHKILAELNAQTDGIRKLLYVMISGLEDALKKASDDAAVATNVTISLTVWGTAVAFTTTIALSVTLILFNITTPLTRLVQAMREMANGNLQTHVPGLGRKDEIGLIAGALLVFRENGEAARTLEEEACKSREEAERERARNAAAQDAAAREQKIVVEALAVGLAGLAHRDLTQRISNLPAAYRQLEQDFNAAVDALQEAMCVVSGNSQNILSGSSEISSAADDMARRTEQQAASLEETAAALDQITATGKRAAESASHARDVVTIAQVGAQKTGDVVRRTIDAMGNIETSAQQIAQIIGVIDEIAFQTNLLALNAGVEAARAGDAGRGFAVVASEVRGLAQRSAEAAKQIKALISTSSAQVAQGAELVTEAGSALDRILKQVSEINTVVADIAAGAQEQATGLAQINTAINEMDQATQQNAAMVEQSTAASHSLAREARQLATTMERFRIGVKAPAAPALRSVATARAPLSAPLKAAGVHKAAAALATAGHQDTNWQDF